MKKEEIIDIIRDRAPIRVARRVLAENNFPKGAGWDQIKDKLKEKSVRSQANLAGAQSALIELFIASEKICRSYNLTPANMKEIRELYKSITIDASDTLPKSFPRPAADSALARLSPQSAIPVAKVDSPKFGILVMSSVRMVSFRESLTAAQVGHTTASSYSEIIGIRTSNIQTFDAILIPHRGNVLHILTDAFQDDSQATRDALHSSLRDFINKRLGVNAIRKPVNFFPAIEFLYNSEEGAVRSLEYTTTSSSRKHEWMRNSGSCLRAEIFHKTGMKALSGGYQAYGIQIEWSLDETHGYTPHPALGLFGLYRMTYEADPFLPHATISGCATIGEMEFIINKLWESMNMTKKT